MTLGYAARASSVLALLLPACVENTGIADNDRSSSPVVEVDSGKPEPDAGKPDAGPETDAGMSKVRGTGVDCRANSPKTQASCFGFYCGTNEADILAETKPSGGCGTAVEVAMICEGHLAEEVTSCAVRNGLREGEAFLAGVRACVRAFDDFDPVSDSCVECYAVSALCAKDNCLEICLQSPDGDACAACRQDNGCTPNFYTCAGMPDPM